MGFNCAAEKAKFDREWAKLRKEYANAGMSEKSIQKIYEYDWHCFCRNRAYERRATKMPSIEIDGPDDDRRSALLEKAGSCLPPLMKLVFKTAMHGSTHWKMSDYFAPL